MPLLSVSRHGPRNLSKSAPSHKPQHACKLTLSPYEYRITLLLRVGGGCGPLFAISLFVFKTLAGVHRRPILKIVHSVEALLSHDLSPVYVNLFRVVALRWGHAFRYKRGKLRAVSHSGQSREIQSLTLNWSRFSGTTYVRTFFQSIT